MNEDNRSLEKKVPAFIFFCSGPLLFLAVGTWNIIPEVGSPRTEAEMPNMAIKVFSALILVNEYLSRGPFDFYCHYV